MKSTSPPWEKVILDAKWHSQAHTDCNEETQYFLEPLLVILRVLNILDAGHLPQVDVQAAPKLRTCDVMGTCGAKTSTGLCRMTWKSGSQFDKNSAECFVIEAWAVRVGGAEGARGPEFRNKAYSVVKTKLISIGSEERNAKSRNNNSRNYM